MSSTRIALMRAVNVGGRNRLSMATLRQMATDLGFADAKTLVQSGNLVFRGDRRGNDAIARLLEKETHQRVGLTVDYLVRSLDEWETMLARNPFVREAKTDPSHLVVMLLKTAPSKRALKSLVASVRGPEVVRCRGDVLYITYPAGIGTSKLTGTLIERLLDTRGTARNWNTAVKLAELARACATE